MACKHGEVIAAVGMVVARQAGEFTTSDITETLRREDPALAAKMSRGAVSSALRSLNLNDGFTRLVGVRGYAYVYRRRGDFA